MSCLPTGHVDIESGTAGPASGTSAGASSPPTVYDPAVRLDHEGYARWLAEEAKGREIRQRWIPARTGGGDEEAWDEAESGELPVLDYDGMEQVVDVLGWIEHDSPGRDILTLGGADPPTRFERSLARYYGGDTITSFCVEGEVVAYWVIHRLGPHFGGNALDRHGAVLWSVMPVPAYRTGGDYVMVVPLPVGAAGRTLAWVARGAARVVVHTGLLSSSALRGLAARVRHMVAARRAARAADAAGDVAVHGARSGAAVRSTLPANRAAAQVAEERLLADFGGQAQVAFRTSKGARVVDNLSRGVAREAKVGRTYLTKRIERQIEKDIELVKSRTVADVRAVEWHFFRGKTGIGPSKSLRAKLEAAGIRIVIN